MIFAGSDKFNERELETFIKKKERELILLHVHVVLIYYFYLGFNQSLRYNLSVWAVFLLGWLVTFIKDVCSQISSSALYKVEIYFQLGLYLGEKLFKLYQDICFVLKSIWIYQA